MQSNFAETLRKLRAEHNLTQQQMAELLFVNRSSIANWESGRRLPDLTLVPRISKAFDIDLETLLGTSEDWIPPPNIIIVDDENILLTGGLSVLEKVFPSAAITGFTDPADAVSFAEASFISLAFLDIELGSESGLDLCSRLLSIHPHTNVVFLTAYADYALDAWKYGASGFLLKPLTTSDVEASLSLLRYPIVGLEII